jgi:hypothetical protein
MNQNIKHMLQESASFSEYQLIITDDDYLQPKILDEIVQFLSEQRQNCNPVPVIWTPRHSYTENGNLNCIVCSSFEISRQITPSALNTGCYMHNGFVLSGIILRADCIDYEFWQEYSSNAYFPVIFMGDFIFRMGAYYWNKNIVHHTVLNECHWESWGKNDFYIEARLFTDYVNAFSVMARRINTMHQSLLFQLFSFPSIHAAVYRFLLHEKWYANEGVFIEAIREFQIKEPPNFKTMLRITMVFALFLCASTIIIKRILWAIPKLRIQQAQNPMQITTGKSGFRVKLGAVASVFSFMLFSPQK